MQHAAADLGRLLVKALFRLEFNKRIEHLDQIRPGNFLEVDMDGVCRYIVLNFRRRHLVRYPLKKDIETVDDGGEFFTLQQILFL